MGTIQHVNPYDVECIDWAYYRDIDYQKVLLQKQGQIEPLQVYEGPTGALKIDNARWPYACAQVQAARDLNWETIIVTTDTGEDDD